jgi:hypothetical protein
MRKKLIFFMMIVLPVCLTQAAPDEGMWTFDNPPLKQLQQKYNFTPSQKWLDHVRLSSVRFMDGGSGSFVSPDGLVMTNHHVAVGQLQKISSEKTNYVNTGFYAANYDDEIKSSDLEVNVLVSMENVTKQVLSSIKEGMSEEEAMKARDAVIAEIEKNSLDKTKLRSNVVSLYHGGEYWLYRYKKYTDVRLVFAPERQAAFYGGDSDNFTYPRYDLDVAFFRIYENDKPIKNPDYFKWNSKGAKENELVFVSGNPGSTDRLYTYSQLEYLRDYRYPMILKYLKSWIMSLRNYASLGKEQERRALIRIFGLANGEKAMTGEYQGLLNEKLMAQRKKSEDEFRQKIAEDPELKAKYGDAWDTIDKLIEKQKNNISQRMFQRISGSALANKAITIVQYVSEINKPDAERLDGFHDAQLPSLKFRLFSPAPIYNDFEISNLTWSLNLSLEELGENDPFVKLVLDGRSPNEAAKALVEGSKLADVEFRKNLVDGGEEAVKNCNDPMIVLARKIDPIIRKNHQWYKDNIESALIPASEKIAKARFAVYGKSTYPDATFTLRLSYGAVKGYPMNGTKAPYKTTLYGLYDRSLSFDKQEDFALPQRFWDKQKSLDLSTPVNFVSTCDIIGGNSGSPVINSKAEVVGLIFDGNIESLSGRFLYDDTAGRAVSVHTAYIIEALRKLYDAAKLADEIEGK